MAYFEYHLNMLITPDDGNCGTKWQKNGNLILVSNQDSQITICTLNKGIFELKTLRLVKSLDIYVFPSLVKKNFKYKWSLAVVPVGLYVKDVYSKALFWELIARFIIFTRILTLRFYESNGNALTYSLFAKG